MATHAPRPRSGVTLVELLVVMGIMALLAAIAVTAVFNAQRGQRQQSTEATLSKIQSKLSQKWSAVLADAAREVKTGTADAKLLAYCNNDKDRAAAVWTYLRLKQEFPTTTAEAADITSAAGGFTLKKRAAFSAVPSGGDEFEQSAGLLYEIVKGVGLDGLEGQVGKGKTSGASVFVDAWGRPIAFVRMAYGNELNSPPYSATASPTDPKDPIDRDPRRSVFKGNPSASPPTTDWANLADFWTTVRQNHIGVGGAIAAPDVVPAAFDRSKNWVPTALSAGPGDGADFGSHPFSGGNDDELDNLIGYRLRANRRGDQ